MKWGKHFSVWLLLVLVSCMIIAAPVQAHGEHDVLPLNPFAIATETDMHPLHEPPAAVANHEQLPYVTSVGSAADCSRERCLALTFDDGPDTVTTPRILSALRNVQARATFFVVGNRVPSRASIVRQVRSEGHELGNHSWGHANLLKLPPHEVRMQISMTQDALVAAGVPAPRFFRPPYGARNMETIKTAGIPSVLWNADPEDWKRHRADELAKEVISTARPGAIVVLHDIKPITADALPTILDALKQDYRFVTVSELLDLRSDVPLGEFTGR